MAGLSVPARGLLRLAAVAGVGVGHGLLAAAGGLGDDVLLAAVRELVEDHLLVADRSGDGYAFRHALTREAVYDDLLPGERQQLHRNVARALTDQPALGPPAGWALAEVVAEHWFVAGELELALAASVAAAKAARDVAAVSDALSHYERALQLWDWVTDPNTVAGVERPALLARAAELASGNGEHDRAIRHIDAAIDELDQAGAAPLEMGLVYAEKGLCLWRAGRAEWPEWMSRAAELVSGEPPTPERAGVLAEHAHGLSWQQRYDEASRVGAAALEAARRAGARTQAARARSALASCLLMTSTDADAGLREAQHALAGFREIGDAEHVAYAYGNLVDSLIRLGRLDEAAATAREGAAVGVQVGALRSSRGLLMVNGAEALLLAGRWDECEQAVGRVRDQRAGGWVEVAGLALTALLDACRGRDDASAAAITEAGRSRVDDAQIGGMLCAAQAQPALNAGDLQTAHRVALASLDTLSDSDSEPEVVCVALLADVGLRIEADRAQLGRARRDPTEEQVAVESVRLVAAQTLALRARASAAAHRPAVTRWHQALCEAEVGRAEGRSDPDSWRRAADAGADEGVPHRTAYARFREAEAVLASRGDRSRAIDALTAANVTATQLGAEPLRRELEALARRARIELTGGPSPATRPSPPEPTLVPLGLTRRELEVLRLLAAGYTNPQIGEALYISRKTASHHVSSVLTKLGVTTRVEAAGVAHRVGLTPDTTVSK